MASEGGHVAAVRLLLVHNARVDMGCCWGALSKSDEVLALLLDRRPELIGQADAICNLLLHHVFGYRGTTRELFSETIMTKLWHMHPSVLHTSECRRTHALSSGDRDRQPICD